MKIQNEKNDSNKCPNYLNREKQYYIEEAYKHLRDIKKEKYETDEKKFLTSGLIMV